MGNTSSSSTGSQLKASHPSEDNTKAGLVRTYLLRNNPFLREETSISSIHFSQQRQGCLSDDGRILIMCDDYSATLYMVDTTQFEDVQRERGPYWGATGPPKAWHEKIQGAPLPLALHASPPFFCSIVWRSPFFSNCFFWPPALCRKRRKGRKDGETIQIFSFKSLENMRNNARG